MFGSGTKKVEALTKKMDQLISKETDIRCQLQREEIQPGKRRKREVDNWLARVEIKNQAVNSIVERIKSASFCDFMMSLATETESITKEVEELLDQGSSFSGELVLDDLKQFRGVQLIAPTLKDRSSKMILEEIQDYLFSEDVLRVGIYGVGGVGKTSLSLHINNHFLTNVSPFDHVYWITVGRETSLYKLQRDISKAVGFDLSDFDDERIRASHLFTTLTKRKQCLVILDDIWENISMDDIGVPIEKGVCKLLITTRNQLVCDAMLCKKVKVSPLPVEEAWDLFVDQLKTYDTLSDEVKEIAKLVAEECDGLPLGIKVMATCMRGAEEIHEWRDTLTNLRESISPFPELQDKVFQVLHFSYMQLKDEKLQQCFLYCALYPEDELITIRNLELFRVEGLVDVTRTLAQQDDQCRMLLSRISKTGLMESIDNLFQLHDLVRDMALGIMKKTGAIIKSGMHLKEMPRADIWTRDLRRASLMRNDIVSLEPLAPPNCPNLTILLLQQNPLRNISESFFDHMWSLKILDLSTTLIVSLPDSISKLTNLGALFLRFCTKLRYIPSLSKLRNLSELHLCGSRTFASMAIQKLPEGMENLVNLRLLDLYGCDNMVNFHMDLLSRLSKLEYLTLPLIVKVNGKKLVMLKHLKGFEGQLYGLEDFNQFVASKQFDQLEHYIIHVGKSIQGCVHRVSYIGYSVPFVYSKIVRLCLCSASQSEGRFLLPCSIVDLRIRDCQKERYLPEIECTNELEIIIPQRVSLKNLEKLDVSGCSKIHALFPVDVVEHYLPNLRMVSVRHCEQLKEVFTTAKDTNKKGKGGAGHVVTPDSTITLANLEIFELLDLPSLSVICWRTIICNSLSFVRIFSCKNLRRLPFSTQEEASLIGDNDNIVLEKGG